MQTDFYKLLGVSRTADASEIKKAYRALARQHHPDATQNDPESEEQFKAIAVAYEVLSDPEKRAQYDQYGIDGLRSGGGFNSQGGGGFEFNISDLFESFFGGSGFASSPFSSNSRVSNDAAAQIEVTLTEAAFGVTQTLNLTLDRLCETCSGSGAKPGTQVHTCSTCGGAGSVQEVRQTFFGQMMSAAPCPTCSGMGTVVPDPCQQCNSAGVVPTPVTIELTIPAGVETGSRLRLSGQGPTGLRGSANGDLYVSINVAPHDRFERHGDDLVAVQEISFLAAIFGTTIDIETLENTETLHIPPGTPSGEVFRLGHHGMGRLRGRGRGDILIYITVVIPSVKDLNAEQKELLMAYGASIGEEVAETHDHPSLFEKVKRAFS